MIKKITALVLLFGITATLHAQLKTPQPSPSSKLKQTVGLTTVTLEYSRPAMRGRTIFGDLVPYGKLWRTGANDRTKISFSDEITINGNSLKKGTYAIFTIPNESSWEVIFYTDSKGGGAPATLDESKVALRTTANVFPVPFDIESFSIGINNVTINGASLDIIWENTYVSLPFSVPTDAVVSANIDKTMAGDPSSNDYFQSAVYYLSTGKDLNKAKIWVDKSIAMSNNPAFWQLRQQSLIYAGLGDKKEAITIAKKSLELAKKAGNADYVKMNTESIAKWSN